MRIRIEGRDLPGASCGPSPNRPDGHHNIHVAVQRKGRPAELLGLTRADAPEVAWTLDAVAVETATGIDLNGPYIQGPPRGRFIYLSWGIVDEAGGFEMFRRAKLSLTAVPADVLNAAVNSGVLVGRLGLTDPNGNPVCASVGPSALVWSAG